MNKHQNALQRKPGQTQQEWMSELAKIDNLNEINPEIARKLYAGGVIEKKTELLSQEEFYLSLRLNFLIYCCWHNSPDHKSPE
ncbi:hypothetical protein ACFFJX_30395 [Pseudarcicella hirudinis]|uniref:hypothetical protein n=1 Tax=Pseudarcicella hirudinis TaxID=1079859 RepID=UPI0035E4F8CC